jgi:hypothetical protein
MMHLISARLGLNRTVSRESGMRLGVFVVALVLLSSAQNVHSTDEAQIGSDNQHSTSGTPQPTDIELSDDQLRIFVTKVRDFLYRFGQQLDQGDYEILNNLPENASIWNDQAYARFKHESVALCRRADSYDALGLADEIFRIGEEYHQRYSKRIRLELSQLSDIGYQRVREYMWNEDYQIHITPWAAVQFIQSMAGENAGVAQRQIKKFWCQVANERL